jgi:hypothetical protein
MADQSGATVDLASDGPREHPRLRKAWVEFFGEAPRGAATPIQHIRITVAALTWRTHDQT